MTRNGLGSKHDLLVTPQQEKNIKISPWTCHVVVMVVMTIKVFMKKCDGCGCTIPQERLELLPETMTCVKCSKEEKLIGFQISNYPKGTASEIVLVDPKDTEKLRLAQRANARRR